MPLQLAFKDGVLINASAPWWFPTQAGMPVMHFFLGQYSATCDEHQAGRVS
jgi:hypothetical protein